MALFKIRPAAVSSAYDAWTLAAGTSKVLAVDPGPAFTDDDATSYLEVGVGTDKQGFTLGTRPEVATISSVTVRARGSTTGTTLDPVLACFLRLRGIDGATFSIASINGGWTSGTTANMLAWKPLGGGLYGTLTIADLFDPTFEIIFWISDWNGNTAPDTARLTTFWVEVTGVGVPTGIGQAREVGSRRLVARRRQSINYSLKDVGPAGLDIDPAGYFVLSHQAVPNASGIGAGDLNWQRRPMRAIGQGRFNMNLMKFDEFKARDIRREMRTFWDTGIAIRPGPTAHGVARWDIGVGRTYTRAGTAYAADSGVLYRQVDDDQEMLGILGMGMFRPSTNLLIQSGFRNGTGAAFTGWTLSSGSGTFAEDTSSTIFDPNVVGRSMKITAGSPHSTESTATGTATGSITANTKVSITIEYAASDSASGSVGWRLQRGVDSKWWRASDQTWQVAQQTNTSAGTSGTVQQFRADAIDVGTSNTTLTLTLVVPAGGTSGRVVHFYHAQIEDLPWSTAHLASAKILTDAATVTRSQCRLLITNNSTARFWRRASGTAFFRLLPLWSSGAAVSGYTFTVASVVYDANNSVYIFYDGTNSQWVFRRRAAGVNYDAVLAGSVVFGASYYLAIRWVSASAELNLTAQTQSVFVNGTKGTDVVGAAPTVTASANAAIGGEETTANTADGFVSHITFTEQVLTDQEIAWVANSGGSW